MVMTFTNSLTVVGNPPVFAKKTDFLLLLCHNNLVLRPQAIWEAGENKGVAIQACAICVQLSAGIVHGVVVIIGINDPVVII